jgi:uncharacterized protein YjaZ
MRIETLDVLEGLRAALEAPAHEQESALDARVVQPLRVFWERFAMMMPQATPLHERAPSAIAAGIGLYHTGLDAARGLAALDALRASDALGHCVRGLEAAAVRLDPAAHGADAERVRFALALGDPAHYDPRMDQYTGVGMIPGELLVTVFPTAFNVPRLPAIAVHELNHNVRFRVEPWSPATTVGKYLVDEGVAECFAAEMYGEAMLGRWTTGLSVAEVDALRPRYREGIDVTGFNEIRGWIFGDWSAERLGHAKVGVPDFAGYAVGYRLVRAFLDRTGTSAAEATYLPWREIVGGSRFFE